MKQLLLAVLRCAAFTKKGPRCSFKVRFGSFCGHHMTGRRRRSPRSPG